MFESIKPVRMRALSSFLLAMGAIASAPALAAELNEPPVIASVNHTLDLLMVARAAPVRLDPFNVTGWVYDICRRPASGMTCPPNAANLFGGTRLQLEPGDTLNVRLVNKLPPDFAAKHQFDSPGTAYLRLNPTNLHTHGLLVTSHFPTMADRTYGDNVFVMTLNPANGRPPFGSHLHGDVRYGYTDYQIPIPKSHPAGLFWFHPHAHGIALNQVSAGMAGIITIGQPSDYICTTKCGLPGGNIPVRHMILKDTQVLPPDKLIDQQDPAFCDFQPGPHDPPRRGSCLYALGDGTGLGRGRWFFTLNGQVYPNVTVGAPTGQLWRVTNTSASVSYNLQLVDSATNRDMLVQVVSIDGISVRTDPDDTSATLTKVGGAKFAAVTCPGSAASSKALCVRRLVMFPSSRVELWVTYRDANGKPAVPPPGAKAVLRNSGLQTGPDGDAWPAVDLATVTYKAVSGGPGMPPTLNVQGEEAAALMQPKQLAAELSSSSKAFTAEPDCKPLAKGHRRRIFFNSITLLFNPPAEDEGNAKFGMGYEELDENGKPVPGTFVDVAVFDPDKPTICVPLGPGNTPASERWQLINLAGEDHNFHMHQTKFSLLTDDEVDGTTVPKGHGILHDNVPVKHADGTCLTVADWRLHHCTAHPVTVEIPFTVAGDYVYHCHILEHEDGGMMSRIRVRATP